MLPGSVKRSLLKLVAVALLAGVWSSPASSQMEMNCYGPLPSCPDPDSCVGNAFTWDHCELWCFVGDDLSGYADCGLWVES